MENTEDFIIRVDRTVRRPNYENIIHRDLELTGPSEYDLRSLEKWFHRRQKKGEVSGNTIYDCLKKDNTLSNCLGFADLKAIQEKGITIFRKLFTWEIVYAWKGIMQGANGLQVPGLMGSGCEVLLILQSLDNDWNCDDPALRFGK